MQASHKPKPLPVSQLVEQVSVDALPAGLRRLVSYLGDALAYKLVQLRGGSYVAVPKSVNPEHPLCDLLGAVDYATLVNRFGGEKIEVPKDDSLLRQLRHSRVRELLALGYTAGYVARATHYTRRQVLNIKGAGCEDVLGMQGGLFDAPADMVSVVAMPPKVATSQATQTPQALRPLKTAHWTDQLLAVGELQSKSAAKHKRQGR